jgi:hypothetical protein
MNGRTLAAISHGVELHGALILVDLLPKLIVLIEGNELLSGILANELLEGFAVMLRDFDDLNLILLGRTLNGLGAISMNGKILSVDTRAKSIYGSRLGMDL